MFTVVDRATGEPLARHPTAKAAAHIILTHDGEQYDIRETKYRGEPFFTLWTRKQIANRPWTATGVMSAAETLEQAEAEIWRRVIDARWERHPEALTDEEYEGTLIEAGA